MDILVGVIIALLINALIIWIVGKLNLGLTVQSYVSAIVAAIVIAIVSWIVIWLLGLIGISAGGAGFWGAIVTLLIAAVVSAIVCHCLSLESPLVGKVAEPNPRAAVVSVVRKQADS